MRQHALHVKAWSLMVAVAIVAVCCAAAVHVEMAPRYAIAMVMSSAAFLSRRRYSEALALRRASGLTTSWRQKLPLIVASTTIAVLVIGLSDMAFLSAYYGFLKLANELILCSHWSPYDDPIYMGTGVIIGLSLALGVATSLRRTIWPHERASPGLTRGWQKLWPVFVAALVALALGLEEVRERWSFCTMMAEYHGGPRAREDGPSKTAVHAWLKRWYDEAALRPWRAIHPDKVPSEL
jgi:hypothetical protein